MGLRNGFGFKKVIGYGFWFLTRCVFMRLLLLKTNQK